MSAYASRVEPARAHARRARRRATLRRLAWTALREAARVAYCAVGACLLALLLFVVSGLGM